QPPPGQTMIPRAEGLVTPASRARPFASCWPPRTPCLSPVPDGGMATASTSIRSRREGGAPLMEVRWEPSILKALLEPFGQEPNSPVAYGGPLWVREEAERLYNAEQDRRISELLSVRRPE